MATALAQEPDKRYKVREAAKELGIGQTKLREMIADRKIGSFMIGRQLFVPGSEITRVLQESYRAPFDADAEAEKILAGSSTIHRQAVRKSRCAAEAK